MFCTGWGRIRLQNNSPQHVCLEFQETLMKKITYGLNCNGSLTLKIMGMYIFLIKDVSLKKPGLLDCGVFSLAR